MLKLRQILARGLSATAVMVLCGCGQKGALFLPTEPIARDRATLPQTVFPGLRKAPAATPSAPAAPTGATGASSTGGAALESPSTATPSTPALPAAR
ncbi:MAG: lipoprotein [Xylophilus ampelinus]